MPGSAIHFTKCLLCPTDRQFSIKAQEFNDIPIIGQEPSEKLQLFFFQLEKHLQSKAAEESKILQKLHKENGSSTDPSAAARLMLEHGKHMNQLAAIPVMMSMARAFMVGSAFETTDQGLIGIRDAGRYHLHNATRKNTLTDATIQSHVAQLGLDTIDAEPVFALLKEMRDILTEQGQYSPKIDQPAIVG